MFNVFKKKKKSKDYSKIIQEISESLLLVTKGPWEVIYDKHPTDQVTKVYIQSKNNIVQQNLDRVYGTLTQKQLDGFICSIDDTLTHSYGDLHERNFNAEFIAKSPQYVQILLQIIKDLQKK